MAPAEGSLAAPLGLRRRWHLAIVAAALFVAVAMAVVMATLAPRAATTPEGAGESSTGPRTGASFALPCRHMIALSKRGVVCSGAYPRRGFHRAPGASPTRRGPEAEKSGQRAAGHRQNGQ
jgi:hypothetical protein